MKKLLLLLIAILFSTSTAFAEYTPIIRQVENGCPGLDTYIVGLTVDDPGGITSVSDMNIESGVHQLTLFDTVKTPYSDPIIPVIIGNAALLDTCFLLDTLGSYGNGCNEMGGGYTESHDGSDPYNITAYNSAITSAGIGNFEVAIYKTTAAIKNPPEDLNSVEFMQIVVPHGGTATLTGLYTNTWYAERALPMIPFTITVPEPSTMALLLLSCLCLAGIRLRKK